MHRIATSLQLVFAASEQDLVSVLIKTQLGPLLICVTMNFLNFSLDPS